MYKQSVDERIKMLRAQMLIHSYLYYWTEYSIWDDYMWQKRANELRDLQSKYYPKLNFYDDVFKDWDGSTGYHLPKDEWIVNKAEYIYKIHTDIKNEC